jgi:hypothetical protein
MSERREEERPERMMVGEGGRGGVWITSGVVGAKRWEPPADIERLCCSARMRFQRR